MKRVTEQHGTGPDRPHSQESMTEQTQFHPGRDPPAIDEGRGQDADTASVRDKAAEPAQAARQAAGGVAQGTLHLARPWSASDGPGNTNKKGSNRHAC
jgi:hypothetical protein